MKRLLVVLFVLLCLVFVGSCGFEDMETTTDPFSEDKEATPLYAGFAQRDFTPTEMGGHMPGASFAVIAKKVEMPLLANAAAFESNGTAVILISVDMLRLAEEDCDGMRRRISQSTAVPEENILIAATHTHTGVGLNYRHNQNLPDTENYNRMMDMVVEAGIAAWNERERARMGFGKTELLGYSFCREAYMKNGKINTWPSTEAIDRLIGEPDPAVNMIRVDDLNQVVKCFIVNYANHPDSSSKSGYNPDYPGYMREKLKETYGEDIVVLYLNGAEGDVNYVDYINGKKKAGNNRSIGTALAEAVIELNETVVADDEYPAILSFSQKHAIPQGKPSKEDFAWAESTMKKIAEGVSVGNLNKKYAWEYTNLDYSKLGATYDVEIHAIVIGEFAMVGLPFEPYSEIGWKICEGSPFATTFVVSQANGANGYVGPDFIYGTASYGARYSYYTSRSAVGAAPILITKSIGMLKEMHRSFE